MHVQIYIFSTQKQNILLSETQEMSQQLVAKYFHPGITVSSCLYFSEKYSWEHLDNHNQHLTLKSVFSRNPEKKEMT